MEKIFWSSKIEGWFRLVRILAFLFLLEPSSVSCLHVSPSKSGPYRLELANVLNCTVDDSAGARSFVEWNVSTPKAGKMQTYSGRTFLSEGLNDEQHVIIRLDRLMGDRFKKGVFILHLNKACTDSLRLSPSLFKMLYGPEEKCPVPPGEMLVRNETIKLNFPEVPVFPYGTWKAVTKLYRGNRTTGCFVMQTDVLPK